MNGVILFALLVTAAFYDWRRRKVPNWLTLPLIAAGLWEQWQAGTVWTALGGVAGAFLLTVGPVVCKGMGMGDQKLLMAIGAWSSWSEVYLLFLSAILLCLISIVLLPRVWAPLRDNLQRLAAGWSAHRQLWLPGKDEAAISFPFAVFLLGAYGLHQLPPLMGAAS
ncbi:A24 family peptidase [Brevibacillus sp. GCM10020057]|uniref:A24 family peptidase n=1 Tax=Brevibacillus sp. GCM10020057 TaxID=3317327 RepID=UPI00362D1CBD